jgi:hypothetical protein
VPRAPVNHLAHAVGIADAEVGVGADGEGGFKNTGEQLVR